MLRVYVATAFPNKAQAQFYMGRLRAIGIEITHDWTTAEQPLRGETTMPPAEQQAHAIADTRGVMTADVVWIIAPETGGTGCWFEMGVAAGLQLAYLAAPATAPSPPHIFVSGPARTIFTSLFTHFDTHDQALARLVEEVRFNTPLRQSAIARVLNNEVRLNPWGTRTPL